MMTKKEIYDTVENMCDIDLSDDFWNLQELQTLQGHLGMLIDIIQDE